MDQDRYIQINGVPIRFGLMRDYIEQKSSKDGEHVLWTGRQDAFGKPSEYLGKSLPHIWYWLLRTNATCMYNGATHSLRQSCDIANCISCWYIRNRNCSSIRQLDIEEHWFHELRRFFKKCQRNDTGCMIWTGAINDDGYGRHSFLCKIRTAHEVAWELFTFEDTNPQLNICHRCNTRRCVNPVHLYQGTVKDNAGDRVASGKQAQGEKSTSAKITNEQAITIANRLIQLETATKISRDMNVAKCIIHNIAYGRCWQNILSEETKSKLKELSSTRRSNKESKIDLGMIDEIARENKWCERKREHIKTCVKIEPDSKLSTPHWLWQKTIRKGYGRSSGLRGKTLSAHQMAYMAFNGYRSIPNGLIVRHKCLIKHCCNPHHLEIGTHKQNNEDMKRDGTYAHGERAGGGSLTTAQVLDIRARSSNIPHTQLAIEFDVTCVTISDIRRGLTWKHLLSPIDLL